MRCQRFKSCHGLLNGDLRNYFNDGCFFPIILDQLLADFDLDVLRRVINECASLDESIDKMLVEEVALVA